jgi:hypothetical protein
MNKLTKIFLLLFLGCLLLLCSKPSDDNKICGYNDPVNELPWLKSLVDTMAIDGKYYGTVIYYETYNLKSVFYIQTLFRNCILCDTFYCDGTRVEFLNSEDALKFGNNMKKNKIIWIRDN